MVSERFWAEGFSAALKINFVLLRKYCGAMKTHVVSMCLYLACFMYCSYIDVAYFIFYNNITYKKRVSVAGRLARPRAGKPRIHFSICSGVGRVFRSNGREAS